MDHFYQTKSKLDFIFDSFSSLGCTVPHHGHLLILLTGLFICKSHLVIFFSFDNLLDLRILSQFFILFFSQCFGFCHFVCEYWSCLYIRLYLFIIFPQFWYFFLSWKNVFLLRQKVLGMDFMQFSWFLFFRLTRLFISTFFIYKYS